MTTTTWRDLPAAQQPVYENRRHLAEVCATLGKLPPLIFAGEADTLTAHLGRVAEGKAFVLQAGDCAESLRKPDLANSIRRRLGIMLQMAVVLSYGVGVPVIKIGRMAGQFAKPRSAPLETRGSISLPSFRGEIINGSEFDAAARRPDPERMLHAYNYSASMLNLVRGFTTGGFASLSQVHAWNLEFVSGEPQAKRYEEIADAIDRAIRFMGASGVNLASQTTLSQAEFYASHEALLLPYEAALTRTDSLSGRLYDCSGHLLWIGERTRQLDGAHVAFLADVHNPIAVKLGPTTTPDEVIGLCERLNPTKIPGRLSFITRMGAGKIRDALPPLLRAAHQAGHTVPWICDPMHGNTFTSPSGHKTRHLDAILEEIDGFFAVCHAQNIWPGGIHLENTPHNVTECLGGTDLVMPDHLGRNYQSPCDPRLNWTQSLDLAFTLAEQLQQQQ